MHGCQKHNVHHEANGSIAPFRTDLQHNIRLLSEALAVTLTLSCSWLEGFASMLLNHALSSWHVPLVHVEICRTPVASMMLCMALYRCRWCVSGGEHIFGVWAYSA